MVMDCEKMKSLTNPKKPIERKMFREILAILVLEFMNCGTNMSDFSFGDEIGLPEGDCVHVTFQYEKGAVTCETGDE